MKIYKTKKILIYSAQVEGVYCQKNVIKNIDKKIIKCTHKIKKVDKNIKKSIFS